MKQRREGRQLWQDIWVNHSKTWGFQLNTQIHGDQLDEDPPFEPLEEMSIIEHQGTIEARQQRFGAVCVEMVRPCPVTDIMFVSQPKPQTWQNVEHQVPKIKS